MTPLFQSCRRPEGSLGLETLRAARSEHAANHSVRFGIKFTHLSHRAFFYTFYMRGNHFSFEWYTVLIFDFIRKLQKGTKLKKLMSQVSPCRYWVLIRTAWAATKITSTPPEPPGTAISLSLSIDFCKINYMYKIVQDFSSSGKLR